MLHKTAILGKKLSQWNFLSTKAVQHIFLSNPTKNLKKNRQKILWIFTLIFLRGHFWWKALNIYKTLLLKSLVLSFVGHKATIIEHLLNIRLTTTDNCPQEAPYRYLFSFLELHKSTFIGYQIEGWYHYSRINLLGDKMKAHINIQNERRKSKDKKKRNYLL